MITIFRILVLADIHGNIKAISKMLSLIQQQNLRIDLVLIAGDLPETTPISLILQYIMTHGNLSKTRYTRWVYQERGRSQFVQRQIKSVENALTLLRSLEVPIVYVPGNVDSYEVQQLLKTHLASEVYFLNSAKIKLGSLHILGYGGSLLSPKRYKEPLCDMEFNEHEFSSQLEPMFKICKTTESTSFKVLITHEPPAFRFETARRGTVGGSLAISRLIDHLKPELVIFGHYHEFPIVKKSHNTIYLNPGPLACYYFALVDIVENRVKVNLKKMTPVRFDIKNMIYGYRLSSIVPKQDLKFVKDKL